MGKSGTAGINFQNSQQGFLGQRQCLDWFFGFCTQRHQSRILLFKLTLVDMGPFFSHVAPEMWVRL